MLYFYESRPWDRKIGNEAQDPSHNEDGRKKDQHTHMRSRHLFVPITNKLVEKVIRKVTRLAYPIVTVSISEHCETHLAIRTSHSPIAPFDKSSKLPQRRGSKYTFWPPFRLHWMILKHRIWILEISVPQRRPNDFVPNIRVDDLEPARRGVRTELANLAVPQLDKAGRAGVVAEEAPKTIQRGGIALAFALDNIVELGILGNFAKLEGHACRSGMCP